MRKSTTASLAAVAFLAAASANAEQTGLVGPPRAFTEGTTATYDASPREIVSTPAFSPLRVVAIGVWDAEWLRWTTPAAPLALEKRNYGLSSCFGATCILPRSAALDVDPKTATPTASTRAILGIGPIGAAALAMFSCPPLPKSRAMAMHVAPMFALGGGGLEMRGVWW